ncbi:hypothetical protein PVAP13_3KG389954 [Panicum virgatum]|uniref:DUF4371 domain-containing protein n=1 Tax=Panicum virgatum TaxID=38727 RepID=A0A8T0UW06_PANVG|nr:hypothetical protein PVAP13_3KG389954 [Panicum virgatum]
MERYFKQKASCPTEDEINWDEEIKYDPKKVRRKYLENGPCQPRSINFSLLKIGEKEKSRRFMREWFDEFDARYDAFVVNGWDGFHRKERIRSYIGEVGGLHYNAMKKCDDLLNTKQDIDVAFDQINEIAKKAYFTRLNGSIDTTRLLLKQELPFCGHDEYKESYNRGNFLEFYDCVAEHDPILCKRDIEYSANEVVQYILEELDVSCKEQMAVVLRYVDKCGIVKERFVGLVHVSETTSSHLKSSIDSLLAKIKLSLKQYRGQGYDGASNMRGSAKRRDMIRDINCEQVRKALGCGQLEPGTGLSQEQCLQIPGGTRWSSHYKTLKSLVNMFPTIIEVLKVIEKDDKDRQNRDEASNLLIDFQSFDFVFYLYLLLTILSATNTLSLALQHKDPDIVNAIGYGWDKLLDEVNGFCDLHEIDRVEMERIRNKHHYAVDCFNDVIDWLVDELDSRFSEATSQLLICLSAFNPRESFQAFNGETMMSLAELYPDDSSKDDMRDFCHQLCLYIADVRADNGFSNINTIAKTSLSNRMGDEHLSHRLICYIEKEEMKKVTNEAVVRRFITMEGKGRKYDL